MQKSRKYTSLINILLILAFTNILIGQKYNVTVWGVPIGSAEIQQDAEDEMTFNFQSNKFIDYIFPIDLEYYSKFNKYNYTVIETEKTTKQGAEKQNFTAVLAKENILVYSEQDTISLEPNTYSLLSLLVKIMNSPVDSIDTKWFNLENEGILYETRLLWNDTTTVSFKNKNVLCNHYRLDLRILDDTAKIYEKTDYFNDLFFDINSTRQIWVEKWQKQPKIIKIEIKNNLINLTISN